MTTVVLVHGAWHGAWCWEHLLPHLDRAGLAHVAVDLPLTGHLDDVGCVRDTLDALDGPKVLVGHSYGGLVISGAAEGRDDISHLVYVCAFLFEKGHTVADELTGQIPTPIVDAMQWLPDGRSAIIPEKATAAFFAHCPTELAEAAIERLRAMDASSTAHECLGDPWRSTPSTYVVCEQDQAISADAQHRMATRAGRVVSLDTDHSPFVSAIEETAAVIVRAAD
ncbi:MAG: alpha/beta hydrolase [Acidimicrobiales bacterium]